jgi:hypothetical protein
MAAGAAGIGTGGNAGSGGSGGAATGGGSPGAGMGGAAAGGTAATGCTLTPRRDVRDCDIDRVLSHERRNVLLGAGRHVQKARPHGRGDGARRRDHGSRAE